MKKRILGFVLALALTPAVITPNPFSDLKEDMVVYDPALWAYYTGVTNGYGGRQVLPRGRVYPHADGHLPLAGPRLAGACGHQ